MLTYAPLLHRCHSNQSLLQTARGHFHLKGHFPSPQDSFGWNHCKFYLYLGSSMKAWRKNSNISSLAVLCQPHRPVPGPNAPTSLWSSCDLCNFMLRGINPSSKCWLSFAPDSAKLHHYAIGKDRRRAYVPCDWQHLFPAMLVQSRKGIFSC